MRLVTIGLLVTALSGCGASSKDRFVVNATPFNLLKTAHPGFCVAVDSSNPQGVWWWEPGKSGCSTRSTAPDAMRGANARVRNRSGVTDIRFDVELMIAGPLQVRLTVDASGMRDEASGEQVKVHRLRDLDVPFDCCPQPLTSR